MAPRNYALDVWAGNTFTRPFIFKTAAGDPFDLTGSKLVFKANNGSVSIIRKATDDDPIAGFEITDAAAGEVLLSLTVTETRALPAGQLRYEIERWVGAEQISLLYGTLTVTTWVNDDVDP